MEAKKKTCKRCQQEKRIWARGLCQSCDIIENPAKYKIEKKATTKKRKTETFAQIEKKQDKVFSEYVRLRDADEFGMVECFTSGKVYHWTKLHCGHFMSRRHKSTRWHELNCMPQSVSENLYNQGNNFQFALNLDKKFGVGTAEMLLNLSKESVKHSREYLYAMIEDYTDKVNKLKEKLK